jgi:hypothetical protein
MGHGPGRQQGRALAATGCAVNVLDALHDRRQVWSSRRWYWGETTLVVVARRSYGGSPRRFCARAARQTLPGSLNFTVGSP